MSDYLTLLVQLGAAAPLLLALCVLLRLAVVNRRTLARCEKQEKALQVARGDLRALCRGAVHMGERILGLEQRQRLLNDQQERLTLRDPGEKSYRHAIQLVHDGVPLEELTESCGITTGEAELLRVLHGSDGDHKLSA